MRNKYRIKPSPCIRGPFRLSNVLDATILLKVRYVTQPKRERAASNFLTTVSNPWSRRPPKDWKPRPWFPIPWNRFQINAFDKMPSFGFIHRPTFVKFVDDDGKPVTRRDAREKILEAGWQQALLSLPEAERGKGPSRIIAAFGDKAEQEMLLETTLRSYAAMGGPTFDSRNSAQFSNTDRRLANTSAATFFSRWPSA